MSKNRNKIVEHARNSGNGFTPVPNELWKMPISNNAKLVFTYLISCFEDFDPGYDKIQENCALGKDSIRSAIDEMVQRNMIAKHSGDRGMRNTYSFIEVDSWNGNLHQPEVGGSGYTSERIQVHSDDNSQSDRGGSRYTSERIQVHPVADSGTLVGGSRYTTKKKELFQETRTGEGVDGYAGNPNPIPSNPPNEKKFFNDSEVNRSDTPSFRTMIGLLQQQNGGKIPRAAEIPPFVSSCKDRGLTVDDISAREFIKVFFDGAKALKKKVGQDKFTEWKESVENQLEQAKAAVYFAGSLDMNSEPEIQKGKIVVNHRGESNLHEETFDDIFPNFIVSENDD